MLEVRDIHKTYEGQTLLAGVSFEVRSGEIVCLLGESGSGKSTLLRIIAGLEPCEAGKVYWDGIDMSAIPPHKRGFGLMFQDYALFPHRTVTENVAFGLRMQNLPKEDIEAKTLEALRAIRMEAFADRPVTELSGGEQQRVALARALAPDPRLLMLDEPLGALDHSLRLQLMEELREVLHESRKPAIYVTHDREEAFAVADRLLILHQGVIAQEGTAKELYEQPANAWIAGFLGLGNLVPGVVSALLPALRSIPSSLRQAASTLGADGRRVFREVDLPLLLRPLLVSMVFAFTISLGEFGASSFLSSAQTPTIPVAIYRYISQPGALNYGQALAMSSLLLMVCAAGIFLIEKIRLPGEELY